MNSWIHNIIKWLIVVVENLDLLHIYLLTPRYKNPVEIPPCNIEPWLQTAPTGDCSHEDYQLLVAEFHKISQKYNAILNPDFTIIISNADCWILLQSTKAFAYSRIQNMEQNNYFFSEKLLSTKWIKVCGNQSGVKRKPLTDSL